MVNASSNIYGDVTEDGKIDNDDVALLQQYIAGWNVKIDEEKAMKWMGNGAQPTDTVKNLFSKQGIMKKFAEAKNAK